MHGPLYPNDWYGKCGPEGLWVSQLVRKNRTYLPETPGLPVRLIRTHVDMNQGRVLELGTGKAN